MADFRKWLFAFAVVALMLGLQVPASAQFNAPAFACTANAGVPPIVRSEGVTELVGDLILNCTGGSPTLVGTPIPLSNFQVFLNTNITSRILNSSNLSEATLLIDEPYPTGQPPVPASVPAASSAALTQTACQAVNSTNCAILSGVATPFGTNWLSGQSLVSAGGIPVGPTGPYNGSGYTYPCVGGTPTALRAHVTDVCSTPSYNVFQGFQNGVNSVAWLGVPVDAPGTSGVRVIRITNVRANACLLGVSSTLIPTQIQMFISVNGSQQVTINNPQQTVAFIQPGLIGANKTNAYTQCNNLNASLLSGSGGVTDSGIVVTATEGFASSFKVRSYAQSLALTTLGTPAPDSPASLQNIPGFSYNTESGFVANAAGMVDGGTGSGAVGLADTGTEITFSVAGIGAGVNLFAPATLPITASGSGPSGTVTGWAILIGGGTGGQISISGTTASVTYEVVQSDPNVLEELDVPVTVAYISNTGSNLPGVGQSTVAINFSPLSTVPTASSTAPIPRFCQPHVAGNFFSINTCSCNLLFPFVTNQAGFDTGIAIANTTADTLNGVVPQQGTVTLTYYGGTTGGGAAPASQTSTAVAAGSELVFTLSNGGNLGIAATPGFQGYIIARANFQYCHAFAFISDIGAQKLAEGYLAIQLDVPGLNRTGQAGENEGN